jgi:hypothetical protein
MSAKMNPAAERALSELKLQDRFLEGFTPGNSRQRRIVGSDAQRIETTDHSLTSRDTVKPKNSSAGSATSAVLTPLNRGSSSTGFQGAFDTHRIERPSTSKDSPLFNPKGDPQTEKRSIFRNSPPPTFKKKFQKERRSISKKSPSPTSETYPQTENQFKSKDSALPISERTIGKPRKLLPSTRLGDETSLGQINKPRPNDTKKKAMSAGRPPRARGGRGGVNDQGEELAIWNDVRSDLDQIQTMERRAAELVPLIFEKETQLKAMMDTGRSRCS